MVKKVGCNFSKI